MRCCSSGPSGKLPFTAYLVTMCAFRDDNAPALQKSMRMCYIGSILWTSSSNDLAASFAGMSPSFLHASYLSTSSRCVKR
jgi:hypothetical protein